MEFDNKVRIYFLMLLFGFSYSGSNAQVSFGIRLEPLFFLTNIEKTENQSPIISNDHSFERSVNAALNFSLKPADRFLLSIRPGIIFGNNLYFGANAGIFASYSLSLKSYIVTGINTHFTNGWGGHTYSGSGITTPYFVVGCGSNLSDKLPIEIQLNLPLNQQTYGTYREFKYPDYIRNNYKVAWLIKFGFGLDWEL